MKQKTYKRMMIYAAFVGPMLAFFLLLIMLPFFRAILYSFQDWDGISSEIHWVGWENYRNIFHDARFLGTISFTLKYTAVTVIGFNVIGLMLAVALNMTLKTKNLLRTAFFIPTVMSAVIVGYLWNMIIANAFPQLGQLTGLHLFQINWFTIPEYAFWAVSLVTVWQGIGYYIMLYLAGLQGVPHDLLEAARIDGAGKWTSFWNVVLPLIRPSITICLFFAIMNGFKSFDINYSLTMGGPFGTTESLAFQIYQDAFNKNLFSYASAKSVVFYLIVGLFTFVQVAVMKRKEVEA